jgi:hypothetical protein
MTVKDVTEWIPLKSHGNRIILCCFDYKSGYEGSCILSGQKKTIEKIRQHWVVMFTRKC